MKAIGTITHVPNGHLVARSNAVTGNWHVLSRAIWMSLFYWFVTTQQYRPLWMMLCNVNEFSPSDTFCIGCIHSPDTIFSGGWLHRKARIITLTRSTPPPPTPPPPPHPHPTLYHTNACLQRNEKLTDTLIVGPLWLTAIGYASIRTRVWINKYIKVSSRI